MNAYKTEFLELALELGCPQVWRVHAEIRAHQSLLFNAGCFTSGYAAAKLGRCYASAIAALDHRVRYAVRPAYKGIPLVVLSAASLASPSTRTTRSLFNRKSEGPAKADRSSARRSLGAC